MDVKAVVDKLEELGLLRTSRIIGNYYQIYCPIHNDGNEKNPSCGILLHEEVRNGNRYPEGFCHCFSCGYAKSLADTIIDILKSKNISNRSGLDWLKENVPGFEESEFDYLLPQETVQNLNAKYAVNYIKSISSLTQNFIPEEELATYRFTVPYMYERRLTDEIIEKFDIGVDLNYVPPKSKKTVPCITFPVRDLNGNTLFVFRRAIDSKKFFLPQGINKPLYGVYELGKDSNQVILCESIFNALTCWVYGYPAIALLGTGTPEQIVQLKRLGVREFILGLDPDDAGDAGARRLRRGLKSNAIIRQMHGIPVGKDINDLEKSEFLEILQNRY